MTSPHLHDIDAVIDAAAVLNRGLSRATVAEIERVIQQKARSYQDDLDHDEWLFSEAIDLIRQRNWPSAITAEAIAAAIEVDAGAAGVDKWSFSAATTLISSRQWPTTPTEAALIAERDRALATSPTPASARSSHPLIWRKRLDQEAWNSDDGRWRVAKIRGGYELSLALLATFDPPVLVTSPTDVAAFDTAAFLTDTIDSGGFDALRSLVTYWQNAYDAAHLAAKDARAGEDSAHATLAAVRSRAADAWKTLCAVPTGLDADRVIDIAKRDIGLITEALGDPGQVPAIRCAHCDNVVTEQTDGTWFAEEGSITLCAPNLPHEPTPSRHEVFVAEDGQNSIRLTREAAEESYRNSIRLQRLELDAYKQSHNVLEDENIALRAERDYLAAELESARSTINASSRQIEELQGERDTALAKNSATASDMRHRAAYAKQLAESGMDPEWAEKYKTLSGIFDTCATILDPTVTSGVLSNECTCTFVNGPTCLYVYDPRCPVLAVIATPSADTAPVDEFSFPFYKTTLVIWSDYNPAGFSIQELGRDADGGGSIATIDVRGPANPDTDPSFAGAEDFFEYTPRTQR